MQYLNFCDYSWVWRYDRSVEFGRNFNVDIFARSVDSGDYSIIGEVKSREVKKFSKEEAAAFIVKFEEVKKLEQIDHAVGFIFSRCGFPKRRRFIAVRRGLPAAKMSGGWSNNRKYGTGEKSSTNHQLSTLPFVNLPSTLQQSPLLQYYRP